MFLEFLIEVMYVIQVRFPGPPITTKTVLYYGIEIVCFIIENLASLALNLWHTLFVWFIYLNRLSITRPKYVVTVTDPAVYVKTYI